MYCARVGSRLVWLLALALVISAPSLLCAQTSSSSGSSGNTTNNNNFTNQAGVTIDAQGVLRTKLFSDPTGQLMRQRVAAARATLNRKVASYSKLRYVSLNRLEQAILDHQSTVTDEMRYLAGLQRVRYVFFYPDSQRHRPGRPGRRLDGRLRPAASWA